MINVQWGGALPSLCYAADELTAAQTFATNNNLLVDWSAAKPVMEFIGPDGEYEYLCAPIVGLQTWNWS